MPHQVGTIEVAPTRCRGSTAKYIRSKTSPYAFCCAGSRDRRSLLVLISKPVSLSATTATSTLAPCWGSASSLIRRPLGGRYRSMMRRVSTVRNSCSCMEDIVAAQLAVAAPTVSHKRRPNENVDTAAPPPLTHAAPAPGVHQNSYLSDLLNGSSN